VWVTKNSISIIISTTASMWPPYCMYSSHIRLSERNSRPDPPDEMWAICGFCVPYGPAARVFWVPVGGRGRWSHDPGRVRLVTSFCRPSPTEPAWPHASGTSAWPGRCGRIGLQLIQPPTRCSSLSRYVVLSSVTVMRASLGTVNTCLSWEGMTVYGTGQNSMLRSRVCRSAPFTPDTLSPLMAEAIAYALRLHAVDTVGKRGGAYMCGRMRMWMAEQGPHARPPSWPLVERTLAPSRSDRSVRAHDIEQRSIVYEKCGNDACDINGRSANMLPFTTHSSQPTLRGCYGQSQNNFGTLEWRYIRLCDLDICRWCRMWTRQHSRRFNVITLKTMHVLVAGLPCFELNSWLSHRTWHNEASIKTLHKWYEASHSHGIL
jgi:hypothetical protein